MRRALGPALVLSLLLLLAAVVPAHAHGGSVWFDDDAGPFHIVVQTNPGPDGQPVRFTIVVTRPNYGPPVADATVRLQAAAPAGAAPIDLTIAPEAGQPGFYDAPVPMISYGDWDFTITVRQDGGEGVARFKVPFQQPPGPFSPLWIVAFLPILLAVVIFLYYWRVPGSRSQHAAAPEPDEDEEGGDDEGGHEAPEHDRAVIGNELHEVHAAEADDYRQR